MDAKTRLVLFQTAAFLKMVFQDRVVPPNLTAQALDLLDQIGSVLASDGEPAHE